MKKISALLIPIFALTACGQSVSDNGTLADPPDNIVLIAPDEAWPEICRIQSDFTEDFPMEAVYPKSVPIDGRARKEKGFDGFEASFCTKDTIKNIVAWYKDKYEPLGYKHSNIGTIHFWKKNNKSIFLDTYKEFGEYVQYELTVR